jgi:hypothetical protein
MVSALLRGTYLAILLINARKFDSNLPRKSLSIKQRSLQRECRFGGILSDAMTLTILELEFTKLFHV